SGTSSASTKLIHGGLRYLEHGWFRLVREALTEREVMLRMAPHLIRPLRFVLPREPGMRPAWMLRLGLYLYDHLGGRRILPGTRTVDLSRGALGAPLKGRYGYGFEYSDCQADDSRLVILNALDAAERGAVIRTRTRCVRAERTDVWHLVLDVRGRRDVASARALVNATGPWVEMFNATALHRPPVPQLRLDKGSHIVLRRLFDHDRGYIFQMADGRVVFALPFERDFTLVGTTDRAFTGDPAAVAPAADEIAYLCGVVNEHFRATVTPADVIWSFAGVRSLYGEPSNKPQDTPRDYVLARDGDGGEAALVTVYGGKITTYRRLAEAVLDELADVFGTQAAWTAGSALPGGDFPVDGVEQLVAETLEAWPFLEEAHARRLVAAYGTRIARIMRAAKSPDDLGARLGADLTAAEVRYLMEHEWARTADDVLWRRSKLGLRVSREERDRLAKFMTDRVGNSG
ncbi:MAG: glycerol-3-phosphate dehydrogenase, partial [Alphaproteobacteria bacterium]|nr:glycerol-3-phosphate dehydrogenase [Alphaproteobacteria bacterium]